VKERRKRRALDIKASGDYSPEESTIKKMRERTIGKGLHGYEGNVKFLGGGIKDINGLITHIGRYNRKERK